MSSDHLLPAGGPASSTDNSSAPGVVYRNGHVYSPGDPTADALLVRGIPTEDIMTATRRQAHTLTPFAQVHGLKLTYPADPDAERP